MKNMNPSYSVSVKEQLRRFKVRLKTLCTFNHNKPVKIPNFWYTPFELYLLAHLKRVYFIMTCNEYAYVDSGMRHLSILYPKKLEYNEQVHNPFFIGIIEMGTKDDTLIIKTTDGQFVTCKENETNI